jgi:hypothetical protein
MLNWHRAAFPSASYDALYRICCARKLLDWGNGELCGGLEVVRYTRAQRNNGGVIHMRKGAALFDTVEISNTAAENVREGRFCDAIRADARGPGVGGRFAGRCGVRGCLGCVQYGGVVRMDDGAITFKGGTISNSTARRIIKLSSSSVLDASSVS